MCKRGDIYYVDFGDDTQSNRQCGIRPAVIVSNNKANEHSPLVTVVPLTTKMKKWDLPTHVFIPMLHATGLENSSMALAEHIQTIDKTSLLNKRGRIKDKKIMRQITRALQIQIGAIEV